MRDAGSRLWQVCVVVTVLAPSLEAVEPPLPIGARLRIMTVSPPSGPEEAGDLPPGPVHREDAHSVIYRAPDDERVTLTKRGYWLVGELVEADDQLVTMEAGLAGPRTIRRQDVTRLAVSNGRRSRGRGALLGFVAGYGVGFAGTCILGELYGSSSGGCGEGAFWGGVVYGPMVGAFGAGVGALASGGEVWKDISLDRIPSGRRAGEPRPRVQLAFVPTVGARRGLAVVASFR